MEGWRSRGRSGRDLHPPPCARRGVPAIKPWLPVPVSPQKKATGHSQRLPPSFPLPQGGGSRFPEPPWGPGAAGRGRPCPCQAHTGGTEPPPSRDWGPTGLPGAPGWGGVTKLHETSRHRGKATASHLPRHAHRASQSTQGSQHPSLSARGHNKPKPREGLGDSREGGKRSQLLSGALKEARTGGGAATGRREHPPGPGHPSGHTLPARQCLTRVSWAAPEANPGSTAHGGCRKDMASR